MIITTLASNVTGEIVDVKSINRLCKKHSLLHLVDTAQGAGHIFESFNHFSRCVIVSCDLNLYFLNDS